MTDPRLTALKAAVEASSITKVAEKMRVPRTTLSLVVNEKYPANPENILKRFDEVMNGVHCPHLNSALTREECNWHSRRARPSNPLGLQHWRACRNCHNNPKPNLYKERTE